MARCNKVDHSSCTPFQWLTEEGAGGGSLGRLLVYGEPGSSSRISFNWSWDLCYWSAPPPPFSCHFLSMATAVMVWDYEEDEWLLFCSRGESEHSKTLCASGTDPRPQLAQQSVLHLTEHQCHYVTFLICSFYLAYFNFHCVRCRFW